jgi:hypothetical protein
LGVQGVLLRGKVKIFSVQQQLFEVGWGNMRRVHTDPPEGENEA